MTTQRGLGTIVTLLLVFVSGILILVAIFAGTVYFRLQKSQQQENTKEFQEGLKDGRVKNDIQIIKTTLTLYYFQTKKLPATLDDIRNHPDFSNFEIKLNPNNNLPYSYSAYPDGKGFTISGLLNNGTEYKIDIPIK